MKSFIVTLALFVVATSADVSHLNLNNLYLPPVHHSGASLSGSSNSYTAQPQQLQNIEYSQPEKSVEYPQQQTIEYTHEIVPQNIGADSYTPTAHLSSAEHQIPFAIGADTITPAHLAVEQHSSSEFVADVPVQEEAPIAQYGSYAQQDAHQDVLSGIDTQYAPNGGYIY